MMRPVNEEMGFASRPASAHADYTCIMHPSLSAFIFDLDGTLVDSNDLQIDAWVQALSDHGYKVSRDRIAKEVGKGGDQLVPDLVGNEADEKDGKALRAAQPSHAMALLKSRGVAALPGAKQILTHCRKAGFKVALATSSGKKILQALLESAGIDPALFDQIVNADDAEQSKPQADIYHATLAKLKLSPGECVNVGDTPFDVIAARRAGLLTVGLDSEFNSADTLRGSGARCTYADCAAVLTHWDEALSRLSPRTFILHADRMAAMMQIALQAAERGMQAGEVPIGAAIFDGAGNLLTATSNQQNATGDKITHAEIVAFHQIAGKVDPSAKDLTLVSTLEPCVMCMGAAMEAGVDTILYGLPAPFDGGAERVTPPTSPESQMPRIVSKIGADASRHLLEQWLTTATNEKQIAFVNQLLGNTK